MNPFKVALVAIDAPEVPGWVAEDLRRQSVDLAVCPCQNSEDLSRTAVDADVVWLFGGSHLLTADNLELLQKCGAIIRSGSGTDNVPVAKATQLGIIVANTPDAVNDAVSDHTIALLFALGRQIARQAESVRSGTWAPRQFWPNWHLAGKTLGLVGFGRVSRILTRKLQGFDLNVIAHDPYIPAEEMAKHGVKAESLAGVFSQSDIVSVHCPLLKSTYHLVGEREFNGMQSHALFINTSRGPVVDESALLRALREGRIGGAALDVLEAEPPPPDHPLLHLDNVVVTPHTGGFSDRFYDNMWRLSVETAIDLSQGYWPRSYVNDEVQPRWKLRRRVTQT
jgi:D-3-phosphoglycerate dehydrogenase / 2-oxoglutarate reductase